jgi:hypothetical protein
VRTVDAALCKEIVHYPGFKGITKEKMLKVILTEE